MESGRFWLNRLSRILAETGKCTDEHRNPEAESWVNKSPGGQVRVWSRTEALLLPKESGWGANRQIPLSVASACAAVQHTYNWQSRYRAVLQLNVLPPHPALVIIHVEIPEI